MPDMIKDGKGRGYLAGVNSENRLLTECITYSGEHHANHIGNAYNMLFDTTPTAAGDCFLYLKNSSTIDLVIEGITFNVGSAEKVLIKLNDSGTPVSGSTVTPANLNASVSLAALGTFQVGNDITGLSTGITVDKIWLENTASSYYKFEQDIILGENNTFTLYAVTGGININGTLIFNYHSHI